jgi:hypothetical protein
MNRPVSANRSPFAILCAVAFAVAAAPLHADVRIDAADIQAGPPWQLERNVTGVNNSTVLAAPAALECVELTVDPGLSGPHRIVVGLHYRATEGDRRYYGAAVQIRLDGEPYRILMEPTETAEERVFKTADLTGREVVLSTLSERPAFVDYLRFEPVSQAELAAVRAARAAPFEKDVVAIDDVNVWMWLYTTRSEWDFRDNVGQHYSAGFNRLYWMANAGAVFYHTDVGTRYERDTREFTPRSGYMVENFRPLETGIEAAHSLGMEIFGWYRLNNNFASTRDLEEFGPGLNSEFFMQHPEFRLIGRNGKPNPSKYSFAYPEVRQYVQAICVEMVEKGVDGLMLDLLRHPPLAGYEPPLIDGYRQQFGVDPRTIAASDVNEFTRWSAYRARHSFTQFVIELSEQLRAAGRSVPIGLRCSLAPFAWNRDSGMDVEDLVKRGLIRELCLMNGYLSRPELLHRPHEIAAVSEPYFALCKDRDVKMICGLHGRSPSELVTYARFIHEAGYDGIAYYETDVWATKPAYIAAFRKLKTRLHVTEPWLTSSSSEQDLMVPWKAAVPGASWWQLNLPDTRTLESLRFRCTPDDVDIDVLASEDINGARWKSLGIPDRQGDSRSLVLPQPAPVRRLRLAFPEAAGAQAGLSEATMTFDGNALHIGEQHDGTVEITSHKQGQTVKPGEVFEASVRGNPERSAVEFFWDGAPIRVEKQAPFTWYTPNTLRPGRHRLKVRLRENPLAPSVDEITVTVAGDPPGFGPIPEGMAVVARETFDELTEGRCDSLPSGWEFTRGYGPEETHDRPDGYAEVVLAGGSNALHLVWPGTGPRMKLHLRSDTPIEQGAAEFDIMIPEVRRPVLAGIGEDAELNMALYLVDKGGRMTYNNGRNSHQQFDPPISATAGIWRRIRWEWNADTKEQRIFVDDLQRPVAEDKGIRRAFSGGADNVMFFFFEGQPGELFIDNVRLMRRAER